MKIKEVCDQTGLTARTIRYYIEEQLITPDYLENYLGRRFYHFSESDIETLNAIIVFRKFGFSIADIKTIKENPSERFKIIDKLKSEKDEMIENEKILLEVLDDFEEQDYTFEGFAKALSESVQSQYPPVEDQQNQHGNKKRKIAVRIIVSIVLFLAFRTEYIIFNGIQKVITDPDERRIFLLIAFAVMGATLYGLSLFWGLILKPKSRFAYRVLCFFVLFFLILGLIMNIINVFAKLV